MAYRKPKPLSGGTKICAIILGLFVVAVITNVLSNLFFDEETSLKIREVAVLITVGLANLVILLWMLELFFRRKTTTKDTTKGD